MSSPPDNENGIAASLSQFSLELLRAELARRQDEDPASPSPSSPAKPTCGTKGPKADYSVSAHVFALILILVLSCIACAFPILARRFPRLPIPHHFLFLSRHFGTGVLIATAFVHLLPTAFYSLSDPCLPDFWTNGYKPMPGLVAMIAVLVVVGIEMFFASQGAGHVHGSEFDEAPVTPAPQPINVHGRGGQADEDNWANAHISPKKFGGRSSGPRRRYSDNNVSFDDTEYDDDAQDVGMEDMDRLRKEEREEWTAPSAAANGHAKVPRKAGEEEDSDTEEEDLALELDELHPNNNNTADDTDDLLNGHSRPRNRGKDSTGSRSHRRPAHQRNQSSVASLSNASPQLARRLLLQCMLLEAGILFHSVFIGMAVSVSRGSAFVVLLIAIAFHQTFEGLALGARISAIVPLLPPGSWRPWLMTLAYGTTTPLGQAIGLAIHTLYDPRSEVGLVLVGCMNAISSGLLLFAGLVELLAEDFLSEASYKSLKGRRRIEACACVVLGSLLMALIGAWA